MKVKCLNCGEKVLDSSDSCPYCGEPLRWYQKKLPFSFLIMILGLFIFLMVVLFTVLSPSHPNSTEPDATLSEFSSVNIGMSYSAVCKTFDSYGELISQSELAGIKTEIYVWYGYLGANCNVTFQNGIAVGKAQVGLK